MWNSEPPLTAIVERPTFLVAHIDKVGPRTFLRIQMSVLVSSTHSMFEPIHETLKGECMTITEDSTSDSDQWQFHTLRTITAEVHSECPGTVDHVCSGDRLNLERSLVAW